MKTTTIWASLLLTAATLAGCSNDEIDMGTFPSDSVVSFQVEVNQPVSRATHTDATHINDFGVFFMPGSDNLAYTYNNVRVTKSQGGLWTPAQRMLWESTKDYVWVYAYTPHQPATELDYTAIPVSVEATQTNGSYASDFLYAPKGWVNPGTDLKDGKLPLEFNHAMSMLKINFTLGNEFNSNGIPETNPITDVKVNGTILQGTCDITNGTVTVAGSPAVATSVTPEALSYTKPSAKNEKAKASYQCILIPQRVDYLTVSFKINGDSYEWKATYLSDWATGKAYTLNLSVGKDMVTAGDITIADWATGTGKELETE